VLSYGNQSGYGKLCHRGLAKAKAVLRLSDWVKITAACDDKAVQVVKKLGRGMKSMVFSLHLFL
jgi:hypothetical protein